MDTQPNDENQQHNPNNQIADTEFGDAKVIEAAASLLIRSTVHEKHVFQDIDLGEFCSILLRGHYQAKTDSSPQKTETIIYNDNTPIIVFEHDSNGLRIESRDGTYSAFDVISAFTLMRYYRSNQNGEPDTAMFLNALENMLECEIIDLIPNTNTTEPSEAPVHNFIFEAHELLKRSPSVHFANDAKYRAIDGTQIMITSEPCSCTADCTDHNLDIHIKDDVSGYVSTFHKNGNIITFTDNTANLPRHSKRFEDSEDQSSRLQRVIDKLISLHLDRLLGYVIT